MISIIFAMVVLWSKFCIFSMVLYAARKVVRRNLQVSEYGLTVRLRVAMDAPTQNFAITSPRFVERKVNPSSSQSTMRAGLVALSFVIESWQRRSPLYLAAVFSRGGLQS
jgi:hypothetical protein